MDKYLFIAIDSFLENLYVPHKGIIDTFLIQHKEYTIIKDTPENFVEKNINFLYIYPLVDLHYFNQGELPSPPQSLLNLVKQGKAKLIFIYPNEGNFYHINQLNTLITFLTKNNLTKENTFIFHSNLELKNQFLKYNLPTDLISVEELNYFEYNPWFLDNFIKSNKHLMNRLKSKYLLNLNNNINKNKQYYFNNLNRLPRNHRVFLFSLMHEEEKIKNKSLMSLGSPTLYGGISSVNSQSFRFFLDKKQLTHIYDSFLKNKQQEWLDTGIVLDKDLNINQASNFNIDFYNNSYISIITETEVENGILFFSEKIFKPIVAGHPFILVGGQNSLSKLKEFGYKTFDKWWDESYDSILEWEDRAYEVYKLVYSLSNMSEHSLKLLIRDMHDTLQHNIEVFFDNNREDKLYERILEIQANNQIIKKLI